MNLLQAFTSEMQLNAQLFVLFTGLAFLANGRRALQWSKALQKSALVNIAFIAFNLLMGAFAAITVIGAESLYHGLALPTISKGFWQEWPLLGKAIVFLLVYDFNLYWIHRWLHKISWAWPTHAVHHSDTQMHFLTWSRSHFMELIFLFGLLGFMGLWLGLTAAEIGIFWFIRALHQHYVHAHLDWNHGPLSKIIVSPNYHRWHHANVEAAYDKNFASIFPFYDIWFGTYYNPGSAYEVPTGFDNNPGDNFPALILYPFEQWREMITDKFARKTGEKI